MDNNEMDIEEGRKLYCDLEKKNDELAEKFNSLDRYPLLSMPLVLNIINHRVQAMSSSVPTFSGPAKILMALLIKDFFTLACDKKIRDGGAVIWRKKPLEVKEKKGTDGVLI